MKRIKSEDGHIASELRQVRTLTKYGIVCMAILYGVHNVMVLLGIDHQLLHCAGAILALCVGWKLSRLFNLCATHRVCVIYMCATAALASHVEHAGYTRATDALQISLAMCGILLTIMLMIVCVDKKN